MTIDARIRRDIEARIHSGEWKPGHRIPFEHELVARYGCSRATVSKALGALAKAGLIERRRKAGSFVAQPQFQSAVLQIPDLPELIEARGDAYAWQLGNCRSDTRDADIAPPALFVDGVHLVEGEPFALEQRWISLATVPGIGKDTFAGEPPGTWLLHHIPWSTATHRIRAIEASQTEAQALEVRLHAACLELWRTTWRDRTAVTKVRQVFKADQFELIATFQPTS